MNGNSWVSSVVGFAGNAFNSWMAYETAKVKGSYSSTNSSVSTSSLPNGVSSNNTLLYVIIGLAILFFIKK